MNRLLNKFMCLTRWFLLHLCKQWRIQKWTKGGGLNNRGQNFFLLTVHSRLIDIANIDINSKCSKIHRTMTRIEKYQIQRAFHNKKNPCLMSSVFTNSHHLNHHAQCYIIFKMSYFFIYQDSIIK